MLGGEEERRGRTRLGALGKALIAWAMRGPWSRSRRGRARRSGMRAAVGVRWRSERASRRSRVEIEAGGGGEERRREGSGGGKMGEEGLWRKSRFEEAQG